MNESLWPAEQQRKAVFHMLPFNGMAFLLANQPFCELFSLAFKQREKLEGPLESQLDLLSEKMRDFESSEEYEEQSFCMRPMFDRYATISMTQEFTRRVMAVLEDRQETSSYFEPPLFHLLRQSEEILYKLRQEKDRPGTQAQCAVKAFYGRLYVIGNDSFCDNFVAIASSRRKTNGSFEEDLNSLVATLEYSDQEPDAEEQFFDTFDVQFLGDDNACIGLTSEFAKRVVRVVVDRKYEFNDLSPIMVRLMGDMEDQLFQLRTYREQKQNRGDWSEE